MPVGDIFDKNNMKFSGQGIVNFSPFYSLPVAVFILSADGFTNCERLIDQNNDLYRITGWMTNIKTIQCSVQIRLIVTRDCNEKSQIFSYRIISKIFNGIGISCKICRILFVDQGAIRSFAHFPGPVRVYFTLSCKRFGRPCQKLTV